MRTVINLIGEKFGRLEVVEYSHSKNGSYWKCICECGNDHIVSRHSLMKGNVKSCGCLRKEKITHGITHGMTYTRIYKTWENMRNRCNRKTSTKYHRYGGRGIKVLWKTFEEFRDDMYQSYIEHVEKYGERQTTIDRYPNTNGNYELSNCRRATYKEQNNNKDT